MPKDWAIPRDLFVENIIGDISKGVSTRRQLGQFCMIVTFVSEVEPKDVSEALLDEKLYLAMQEELNQFKRNNVWELVPRNSTNQIGTK